MFKNGKEQTVTRGSVTEATLLGNGWSADPPLGNDDAGGPSGNATEAWAIRTLMNADPGSKEYAIAYKEHAKSRTQFDPTLNQIVTITPDMSAYATPGGQQRVAATAVPNGDGTPPPGGAVAAADGAAPPAGGVPAASPVTITPVGKPKMAVDEANAAAFADRMAKANEILDQLGGTTATSRMQEALSSVPLVGNSLVSDDYQQVQQAQRSFLNAILRRESGAVISPSEFEEGREQYFPVPGDRPSVIAQKAQERKTALANMQRAAGRGYSPPESAGTKEDPLTGISAEKSASLPKGTYYRGLDGQLRVKE